MKRKNQPIAKRGIEHCHWFILPLLLATPTMQFSLDRKSFPGVGAFDHLEWTYDGAFEQLFGLGRGEFEQKFCNKYKCPGVARGGDVEASI